MRPNRHFAVHSVLFCLSFLGFSRHWGTLLLQFLPSLRYRSVLRAYEWLWTFLANGWHWWLKKPVFVRKWSLKAGNSANPRIQMFVRFPDRFCQHYSRVYWKYRGLSFTILPCWDTSMNTPCHSLHISCVWRTVPCSGVPGFGSLFSHSNVVRDANPGACGHMPSTCRDSKGEITTTCLRRTASDRRPSLLATCNELQSSFWCHL